jgi:hypothetical protein
MESAMTAVSEVFQGRNGGGMPPWQPVVEVDSDEPARTRGRASVAVTDSDGNRLVAWVRSTAAGYAADLREAWFWPTAVPTLQRAWAGRYPDRKTVPGESAWLYYPWIFYNHAIGLPLVTAAYALIGVLTPMVWVFLHPARGLLFLTVAAAAAALIL